MYVGDTTDGTGLHNMLYAVLNNAVAEVRCGQRYLVLLEVPAALLVGSEERIGQRPGPSLAGGQGNAQGQ